MIKGRCILAVPAIVIIFLTLFPLSFLIFGSLIDGSVWRPKGYTLSNYAQALQDLFNTPLLLNTIVYALGMSTFAIALGIFFALILSRTNIPFKRPINVLLIVQYIVPNFLSLNAWILLLSPRIGAINNLLVDILHLSAPPFNIYSLWGMIFVEGLHHLPTAYLLMTAAFASMDPSLEEIARVSGANLFTTFRKITIPVLWPSILSTWILLFVRGVGSISVPLFLGMRENIYVLTSRVYTYISGDFPKYGLAGALALSGIVFSAIGIYIHRRVVARAKNFVTITGKGYRPKGIDLGRWRWPVFLTALVFLTLVVIVPICTLVIASFVKFWGKLSWSIFSNLTLNNYVNAFKSDIVLEAFKNTFVIASIGASMAVSISIFVSYLTTKAKIKMGGALDLLSMLPIALPSFLFALGVLWAYIALPIGIYGTIWILVLYHTTVSLPISIRGISSGMIQVHDELLESARVSGASIQKMIFRILMPLLKNSIFSTWFLCFMNFITSLSGALILCTVGTQVIGALIWSFSFVGLYEEAAALSVVLMIILLIIIFVADKVAKLRFHL